LSNFILPPLSAVGGHFFPNFAGKPALFLQFLAKPAGFFPAFPAICPYFKNERPYIADC